MNALTLHWAPPTPDEELAEWRSAEAPAQPGYDRGWRFEVVPNGGTFWNWEAHAPWPHFSPEAWGWAATRQAAMEAAEEYARRLGVL